MAFLTLNGVTVPTAKGGSVQHEEFGSRLTAASGAYLKDVRALKRQWKFATTPMSELRSLAMMGMLQGQGLYLPHTSSSTTTANGRAADFSVVTVRSYSAADGSPSADENGVGEAMAAGCYSFIRETAGSVNLLSAAAAQSTSASGITTTNGSVGVNSSNYWEGTSSVNFAAFGTPCFMIYSTLYSSPATNTTYVISCYIKSTINDTITLTVFNNAALFSASSTPTGITGGAGWKRFTFSFTTPSSAMTGGISLKVAGNSSTTNFYIDALQLETNSLGTFPTSFIAPGSSRASGDFAFSNEEFTGPSGMTLNWWQTVPRATPSSFALQYALFGDNRNDGTARYFRSGITSSTITTQQFTAGDPASAVNASGLVYTGWHMLTQTMRYDPETGEANQSIYFDGTLKSSGSATGLPDSLTHFNIGGFQSNPAFNKMADILLVPYPVDAKTVASWFSAGPGTRGTSQPLLLASGDFIGEGSVYVGASVDKLSVVGYYDAGVWRNNGRVIDFTLEEF